MKYLDIITVRYIQNSYVICIITTLTKSITSVFCRERQRERETRETERDRETERQREEVGVN